MNKKTLFFTIFCVGSLAERLKKDDKDVYHALEESHIISDYIVPCYDTLHTFSKEYIVEDLLNLMKRRNVVI